MTTFQIVWTIILFIIFVGIVAWAFGSRQKKRFEEAARLPLDDDREPNSKTYRENDNG